MPHHHELATAAAAAVGGGVGSWGDERDGGNQRNGVICTATPVFQSPEPGGRYLATPAAAVLWLRLEG